MPKRTKKPKEPIRQDEPLKRATSDPPSQRRLQPPGLIRAPKLSIPRQMNLPRKVKLGDLEVTVVSDEEAEKVDYVICMPEGQAHYFDDDLHTTCAVCGHGIHHRPHVPKNPPKICIECAALLAEKGPEAAN